MFGYLGGAVYVILANSLHRRLPPVIGRFRRADRLPDPRPRRCTHPLDPLAPSVIDCLRVDLDVPELVPDHFQLHRLDRVRGVGEVPPVDALPIDEVGTAATTCADLVRLSHSRSDLPLSDSRALLSRRRRRAKLP